VFGHPHTLEVVSAGRAGRVVQDGATLRLHAREDSTPEERQRYVGEWLREQLRQALPPVVERCEQRMGVHAEEWRIKNMRTRWGTCNVRARRIWLSLRLAQKSPDCLEYVVVHELCHLLEKSHNAVFKAHMDRFFPQWRETRRLLNKITSNQL
jgi:predicted metal-dependent hydrolase